MPTDYDIGAAFAAVEEELIASMMRNLKRHRAEETAEGFEWSMWQVTQLEAMEAYKRRNQKKYQKQFRSINQAIEKAIREAYQQGGMEQEIEILRAMQEGFRSSSTQGVTGEFFRVNTRKLDALVEATVHDMERAESAVLRRANDQYRKIIFNAQVYANTGAGTYEKAVDMATRDFLAAGIQCVVYQNGARHTLSDYADMALRTASKRAYLQGEGTKRQEWGVSTVMINKRNGACPQCAKFCGKVFIDDVWSGGKRSDGNYPLLSKAIEQGLYHPRCKDSHSTYFPELYEDEKPYTREEIAQLEQGERREQKQQNAQRQAERYRRLERHSLDPENRRRYGQRAEEWKALAEQGKPNPAKRETMVASEVYTADYRRKLDQFGEEPSVARVIWQQATKMLKHRSGTLLEDMVFINSKTGEFLLRDDYHHAHECMPSRRMREMLKGSDAGTVIVIHNHPQSGVPSYADLKAAKDGRYKYGVIVGHNGIVFRYYVKENADLFLADMILDRLQKCLYNEKNEVRDAIEQLKSCGVILEVFR